MTNEGDEMSAAWRGSQPVAWAVVYPNGDDGIITFRKEDAEDMAAEGDEVVPLYKQPTLTAEEREAVELEIAESDRHAIIWEEGQGESDETAIWFRQRAKMWRALLERLG